MWELITLYCEETFTQFGTVWRLGFTVYMSLGFQVSMILNPFHSDRFTSMVQYVVVFCINSEVHICLSR